MTQQVMIPQVTKIDTEGFSKQWTHNGLAIVLNDVHIQFATDFANIVLRNFVLQCAAQADAAIKAQQGSISANVTAGSVVE